MTQFRCYTLFDVKDTGITNRKPPADLDPERLTEWNNNRKRQINLDTILQIISLRSQPENVSSVNTDTIDFKTFKKFGFLYENEDHQKCAVFDFTVSHKNVFDDGIQPLGHLYDDCNEVPMLITGFEWEKLPNFLDTTPELRNIYFEVLENG